jgi:hypothetical protein
MDKDLGSRLRSKKSAPESAAPATTKTEFKTPEEVAAADDLAAAAPVVDQAKPPKRFNFKWGWPPKRDEGLIGGGVLLLLVVGLVAILGHRSPQPVANVNGNNKAAVSPEATPKTVASNLTGLQVDPSVNLRPVTAVMVENSLAARPQSGLSQAGVVFEAIAEGGVTRFMALFQDNVAGNVGPIRSARPYYVGWSMGFDAGYAHVGGSPDALSDIRAWGVRDLDQFANGGSYHRVSNRPNPHNVYTSIDALNQLEAKKGYTASKYSGFVRKSAKALKTPTARAIQLKLSGANYNVSYVYNAQNNSYDRSEGGAAHSDAETGGQLSPSVVVAMVIPLGQGALDASGAYYSNYQYQGSGTAYVFQDGGVTVGQWTKADNSTQITFTANGKPLALDPGQTWLTAVSASSAVSYQP